MANSPGDLDVIVPNLHRRYSGVTATNRMVAPRLAKLYRAAWFGSDAPEGIARLSGADLLKLWRRKRPLIWHARRNNEMIAGVALRALGWPLKLVFTSAAQRHHSWITRWLIRQMDAIIATSDISASFLKVKATVIPHGVDTEIYAPPIDRAAAFAEAALPGRYAIGCFGRVRAQKGTDVFVDAMCRLLPRYPDFTAVIVGQVTAEQTAFANDLKKRIEAAGLQSRIVITGELPIEDGAALVSAADDLRLHLAQRGLWPDADRGDGGRQCAGRRACRRGGARGRGRRHRRADSAGRYRCAGCGARTADARILHRPPRWGGLRESVSSRGSVSTRKRGRSRMSMAA